MKLVDEFKAFVMRGNVVDMAVGVIIGGAFGKIVTSLVNDIFMPIIGMVLGNVNFTSLEIKLGEPVEGAEQAAIRYGMFIQEIVNFLIIALCIFMVIKLINKAKKKKEEEPAPAPEPTKEEVLLTEIRDALKKLAKEPNARTAPMNRPTRRARCVVFMRIPQIQASRSTTSDRLKRGTSVAKVHPVTKRLLWVIPLVTPLKTLQGQVLTFSSSSCRW